MDIKDKIIIAKDFSNTPGARYKTDGEWSGEKFLEELLMPKFVKAVNDASILLVDLDGVYGYPSSFVSGSFGKLSLEKGADLVLRHIQFKSDENPVRLENILKEIRDPKSL